MILRQTAANKKVQCWVLMRNLSHHFKLSRQYIIGHEHNQTVAAQMNNEPTSGLGPDFHSRTNKTCLESINKDEIEETVRC